MLLKKIKIIAKFVFLKWNKCRLIYNLSDISINSVRTLRLDLRANCSQLYCCCCFVFLLLYSQYFLFHFSRRLLKMGISFEFWINCNLFIWKWEKKEANILVKLCRFALICNHKLNDLLTRTIENLLFDFNFV